MSHDKAFETISQETGFSREALDVLAAAVKRGGGRMAQFSHPEFGGPGQWMQGGMTMTSDLFDQALAARIDRAATALSAAMGRSGDEHQRSAQATDATPATAAQAPSPQTRGAPASSAAPARGDWWPDGLGDPASTGAQNDVRYAYFPSTRRLAIETATTLTVYDTGSHHIGGVSQQQSAGYTLTFTSDQGPVDLASLPVVASHPRG